MTRELDSFDKLLDQGDLSCLISHVFLLYSGLQNTRLPPLVQEMSCQMGGKSIPQLSLTISIRLVSAWKLPTAISSFLINLSWIKFPVFSGGERFVCIMNCQSLEKGFLIPQCRSFSRPCRILDIFHRYPEYRFLSQSRFLCQICCESRFPGSISRIPLTFLGSREYPSRWSRSPAPFHDHPESRTSVNAIPNTVFFCNPASRTKIFANPAFPVAHPVSR